MHTSKSVHVWCVFWYMFGVIGSKGLRFGCKSWPRKYRETYRHFLKMNCSGDPKIDIFNQNSKSSCLQSLYFLFTMWEIKIVWFYKLVNLVRNRTIWPFIYFSAMNFVYGQNAYVMEQCVQLCNLFNTANTLPTFFIRSKKSAIKNISTVLLNGEFTLYCRTPLIDLE